MALSHAGFTFVGTHGKLDKSKREFRAQRRSLFGLDGVSQISGGRKSRSMRCESWIHNSYGTQSDLIDYLELLEQQIDTTGTLTQTGTIARTIGDVVFEGFEENEILPSPSNLGWLAIGVLHFTELGAP